MKNLNEVKRLAKLRETAKINFDDITDNEEMAVYWREQWEQNRRFLGVATLRAIENGASTEEILSSIKIGEERAREEWE